jgi:hypothetical protein
MMPSKAIVLVLIVGALGSVPSAAGPLPADGHPRTVYFSVGDNQDLLWLPLDSQVSIETALDVLHDLYRVDRVWWRGGQEEIWGKEFVFRPENRLFDRLWRWWKFLAYEGVGTNRIAVKAARARHMPIWAVHNVTDCGSGPDVGYSGFPYAVEDRLRIEHPEYAPVNRWGTWRQGGPVEFAYPGARQGVVRYLVKHTVEGGYDGIVLLTYAENYSQRYADEFGFNEPIVTEFKRRYGVDIRSQPFDKNAWSRLRGEYFTQFLRELHASLAKHGRKIAVCVDGSDAELPTCWIAHGGVRTSGLVHMDVGRWARERLVEEVCVWAPRDDRAAALVRAMELCRGTPTVASALRTRGWMPAGTPRVMFLGHDLETGFDYEHYINQPDERVTLAPGDRLAARDPYARRRFLTAVLKKKATSATNDLTRAARDPDLYVRRLAVRALATTGDPAAEPVLQAALSDAEHSVRCQAVVALGELEGPRSLATLWEAAAREPVSFQLRFRAMSEVLHRLQAKGNLSAKDKQPIIARLRDPNPDVREAALYALQSIGAPASAEMETVLREVMQRDPSPYARELAIVNLRSSFGPKPEVVAAIRAATRDRDDATAVRAVAALALLGRHPSAGLDLRRQALAETTAMFRRYGDGCTRTDKDWGWRVAGEAIMGFGDEGTAVLSGLMADKLNRRLAELAWRVMYLRQGDQFYQTTEEDDRKAHARHPFLWKD